MAPWILTTTPATARFAPAMPVSTAALFTGVQDDGDLLPSDLPGANAAAENVIFFPTARRRRRRDSGPACAAGPETAPDLGAWRGASNTVSRALALIEMGALDEGDVDALADRARRRRAAAAAAVPPAPGRLADRGGADPPRAAGQAADPRDAAADDGDRAGLGLRQRAAFQRDLPGAVPAAAGGAASRANGLERPRAAPANDPAVALPAAL